MGKKWNYLRRAYAINEYADWRATDSCNDKPEYTDDLSSVVDLVKEILDIANENIDQGYSNDSDYKYYQKTKRQCHNFLRDFGN